jgi:hypothetical protein
MLILTNKNTIEKIQNINTFVKTKTMNHFKDHILIKLLFVLIKRKDEGRFSKLYF